MSGGIVEGHELAGDLDLTCDVCIVGSGAGGAVLAAGLAERGLDVVILEEGGYFQRRDFTLQEAEAYPALYQERFGRATADQSIAILQGRSVGGTTTINWTTCYRTPERVLDLWRRRHGVDTLDVATLAPHFDAVEARLSIAEWPAALVNRHNDVLRRGCEKLGWEFGVLRRNVKGCANSGYCGLGCPVDGKQAMGVTYLVDAVAEGARIFADTRADRLETSGDRVVAVHASVLDRATSRPTGRKVTVRAKVTVVAGGAINSPVLLLRSGLDDHGRVGRRTFIHPVVSVIGEYADRIDPWAGAPQSVASHQFIDRGPGLSGFFFEVPPVHPMLAATGFWTFGAQDAEIMSRLGHLCALLALQHDGWLDDDEGGTVSLRADGRPRVDYPVRPHLVEGFRAATIAMARIHLAAGALRAVTTHVRPAVVESEADVAHLESLVYGPHVHGIFTAHQMGGCAMGADPTTSVVDTTLRHHRVRNLFVVDGSALPTSLGVNPSETIYAVAHWARDHVAAVVGEGA